MKGIYLNDIPVDLLLKYFTKDDLQNSYLEPSMIDDARTFYKYSFTVTIDSSTKYMYSRYDNVIDKDIADLKGEIVNNLKDVYSNISISSITSISKVSGGSLDGAQSYIQPGVASIYPHRYIFQHASNSSNDSDFVSFLKNSTESIEIPSDPSNVQIIDSRKDSNVLGGTTNVNLVLESDNNRYAAVNNNVILGYIYENAKYRVQEINSSSQPLFINEFGGKTVEGVRYSNFLRHNAAIRRGINKLVDPIDIVKLKFNPGVIGILQQAAERKLLFYQDFTIAKQYKKINAFPEEDTEFEEVRLPEALKSSIEGAPSSTFSVSTKETRIKEVLNFFDLKRVDAESTAVAFSYNFVSRRDELVVGQPVITNIFRREIKFVDTLFEVKKVSGVDIVVSSDPDLNNSEVIQIGGSTTLKLPVITRSGEKYIKFGAVQSGRPTPALVKLVPDGSSFYVDYPALKRYRIIVDNPNPNATRYPNGYIFFQVDLTKTDTGNKFFGQIGSLPEGGFTLVKYNPTVDLIEIDENNFELFGFSSSDSGVTYTKTYHIRDEIDKVFLVEVTETISSDPLPAKPELKEFMNYEHTASTISTGSDFSLKSQNPTTYLTRKTTPISSPLRIDLFEDGFKTNNHYLIDGYYEERGSLIPNDTFLNEKINAMAEMSSEFLLANGPDFFSVDNVLYNNGAPLKMRIYSEAFQLVLSQNNTFLESISRRTNDLSFDDIEKRIVLSKLENTIARNRNLIEFDSSEFDRERILSQKEINNLNAFQKLLDYKQLPYNERRAISLFETLKREKIFSASDSKELSLDELKSFDSSIKITTVTRNSFKSVLKSLISNFFFRASSYSDLDFYVNSYYKYIKPKLEVLGPVYGLGIDDVLYKEVYSRSQLSESQDELLEKILTIYDDWRIL